MAVKVHHGVPYHLWNPFTDLKQFESELGYGPTVVVRGEGPYIFDERGKRYISGMAGLWNVAVGYGREELVQAAAEQMRKLPYASCFRQVHPKAIELAAKLVEITGGRYQRVYLGSNGTEATETALKITRQYHKQSPDPADRGRYKIISFKGAYHGVSFCAMSTSGLPSDADKYGPLIPGFVQIDPPYCYRCTYTTAGRGNCELECAAALEKKIVAEGPETVAGFIFEPIMGAFGMVDPPEAFYGRVIEICKRHGVLVIADEVVTGFGRTGKLFASQDWSPGPDILCLAKAISSGYLPLAATLTTQQVCDRFYGPGNTLEDGSTSSGHPVCAAVGLANIDIILREKLPEKAARVGAHLKSRLEEVKARRPQLGEVRGRGLMLGLELVEERAAKTPLRTGPATQIFYNMVNRGLLPYPTRNILGLLPPLIIDEAMADEIANIVDDALATGPVAEIGHKSRLVKAALQWKLQPT